MSPLTPEILRSWYQRYGAETLNSSWRTEWREFVWSPKPSALSFPTQSITLRASDNSAWQLTLSLGHSVHLGFLEEECPILEVHWDRTGVTKGYKQNLTITTTHICLSIRCRPDPWGSRGPGPRH